MVRPKTWRAFKLLEQRRQSQWLLSYQRFQHFMSICCRSKKYRLSCLQFWFWMFTFLCDKSLQNYWKMRFIFFLSFRPYPSWFGPNFEVWLKLWDLAKTVNFVVKSCFHNISQPVFLSQWFLVFSEKEGKLWSRLIGN